MKLGLKKYVAPAALGLVSALLAACGDSNPEITSPTRLRRGVDAPHTNASESQRFGMREAPAQKQSEAADLFLWSTPEGWQQLESKEFRLLNMKVGQVECFLSNVAPGSIPGNINRWRQQMGAEVLSEDEIEGLRGSMLFGREAYRMDVSGSYTGMVGDAISDARMLTVIADFPQFALTVKMVGPRAEVEAQNANFGRFVASLGFNQELANSIASAEDDPHAGHGHAPGEGHDEPEAASATKAPAAGQAGQLVWDMPAGWNQGGPRSMRHATFEMSANPGVECYVSFLPGLAGGVLGNINRWLGQVGLAALDSAGLAAMPRIAMLGEQVEFLEAIGASEAILASMVIRADEVMFVKMTGSPAGVLAQKDNFIKYCASLRFE